MNIGQIVRKQLGGGEQAAVVQSTARGIVSQFSIDTYVRVWEIPYIGGALPLQLRSFGR